MTLASYSSFEFVFLPWLRPQNVSRLLKLPKTTTTKPPAEPMLMVVEYHAKLQTPHLNSLYNAQEPPVKLLWIWKVLKLISLSIHSSSHKKQSECHLVYVWISHRKYTTLQRCKYTTSMDIKTKTRYKKKKLFTHVESHASAVSLLKSGE